MENVRVVGCGEEEGLVEWRGSTWCAGVEGSDGLWWWCDGNSVKNGEGDVWELAGVPVSVQDVGEGSAVVCLVSGDVVLASREKKAAPEVLATVSEGIQRVAWSLDLRVAALLTRDGVGVLALREDNAVEVSLEEGRKTEGGGVVSWRGDGRFFAVSVRGEGTERVAVFEVAKDGRGVRRVESWGTVDGGEVVAMSWRPSGDLIAVATTKHGKVYLHEKGGQLRYTVERCSPSPVRGLAWNSSSDLLAVVLEESVEVWSTSNYRWFNKQTMEVPPGAVVSFEGDSVLSVVSPPAQGRVARVVRVSLEVALDATPNVLAVVDGEKVNLTFLASSLVPPPLFDFQLCLRAPVCWVCFEETEEPAEELLVASQLLGGDLVVHRVSRTGSVELSSIRGFVPLAKPQLLVVSRDEKPVVLIVGMTRSDDVVVVDTSSGESRTVVGNAHAIAHGTKDNGRLTVQLKDQSLVRCDLSTSSLERDDGAPRPSVLFDTLRVSGQAVVGRRGCSLYLNDTLVSKLCTSYQILPREKLLVMATLDNHLRFHDISKPDSPALDDRPVERGSTIVVCRPESCLVVMKTMRGSLETVYPRYLVSRRIRELLASAPKESKYLEAFKLARRHKADFGLLCEEGDRFDAAEFVRQVGSSDHLSVFITAVAPSRPEVCMALRKALLQVNSRALITALVTSFLVASPPDYEQALQAVKSAGDQWGSSAFDEALDYVIFLSSGSGSSVSADVGGGKVFDETLGTYDIETTRLVARKTQKDPKEYAPFLDSLAAERSEHLRRAKIDSHLGRFAKSLGWLATEVAATGSDDLFRDCVLMIEKHQLHVQALAIFADLPSRLSVVTRIYATHLSGLGRHRDGAILFESCRDFAMAAREYAECLDWKEALSAASRDPSKDEAELHSFAMRLAERLLDAEDFKGAAEVYGNFGIGAEERAELCIRALTQGRLWWPGWLRLSSLPAGCGKRPECERAFLDAMNSAVSHCRSAFPSQVRELVLLLERSHSVAQQGAEEEAVPLVGKQRHKQGKKAKAIETVLREVSSLLPHDQQQCEVAELLRVLVVVGRISDASSLQIDFTKLVAQARLALEAVSPLITLVTHQEGSSPPPWLSKLSLSNWVETPWSLPFLSQ